MNQSSIGIKDVAQLAGVSVGTVSNVLNRPDSVSRAKRDLVQQAIAQLGYVPNNAARQLKAGISRDIGLIVVDTQNPFYGTMSRAAESAAEELGLGVFVANSGGRPNREEFYLSQFEQQRCRGILVTPTATDLTSHDLIAERGSRIVLVDTEHHPTYCCVSADDFFGGKLAVSHLLELGCQRIAVFGGPARFSQVTARLAGAQAAAAGHPEVSLDYYEPEEMSILAGRELLKQALEAQTPRPDAIFAMNDMLATGVLQAALMRDDVDIPTDIALIGYDDIDFCANAIVPISSIRQPSAAMGRWAVKLLETEIAEGVPHKHRSITLEPELVARQSTLGHKPHH